MNRKQQSFIGNCKKEKQGDNWRKISISVFCFFGLLLLSLWTVGCSPNVNLPGIAAIGTELDFSGVLEVVDVSNPTQPVKISSTSLPSKPYYYSSIIFWKQFMLATTAYGVHLFDMEKPAAPVLLWNLPLAMLSGKATIFKDHVFFPTRHGVRVLHLKNPLEPQWVFPIGDREDLHSHLIDLKVKGDYAYARDAHNYLHVLNLSQPEHPKLVNSYAIESSPSFLLFRALGEEAKPIQTSPEMNVDGLADRIRFFHLKQLDLPAAFSNQLGDWNNLYDLSTNWTVKVRISPQYLSWVYLYDDCPQLWLLPSKENRIYPLDIIPAYTKQLYTSRKYREEKEIVDVIRGEPEDEKTLYLIFETDWKEVKIDQREGGRVTDFQLSADLVYILREHGALLIAKIVPAGDGLKLEGIALLENLSQPSQTFALNENFLYILGQKFPLESQNK